jgi:putative endonuclease
MERLFLLYFYMFYIYILYSATLSKFYIGYTSTTPAERLYKHLHATKGFSINAKDWKIVYQENFDDKFAAMKREKEIKNWKSKIKILALIENYEG